jgi:monothiol bacilliredoxin
MFGWWSKEERDIRRIGPGDDLDRVLEQGLVILFKHSPSCFISWAAQAQVKRFALYNPTVPIYTVSVREDRALSRRIAERTSVQHASPQIIVLQRGAVVSVASHENITVCYLTQAIAR